MFINTVSHYLPEAKIPNDYFCTLNGLTDDHIYQRTGIRTRTKCKPDENSNTMSVEAVKLAIEKLPFNISDVDLIVGASYSPYDTVGTLAHAVQREFSISGAQVLLISSACSSFVNAVEIVQGYFAMNKAKNALVIASEHNSYYNNEDDIDVGHLWGDGAAAAFISKSRMTDNDLEILDVQTYGLAHIDKGPEGVYLRPRNGGITMPDGKNVFVNACKYMAQATEDLLHKNNFSIKDISYFIAHQANKRIIDNVAGRLDLMETQVLSNIEELGNTGCAGCAIALSQNWDKYLKGEITVISVFGGGYSCGAMLLRK